MEGVDQLNLFFFITSVAGFFSVIILLGASRTQGISNKLLAGAIFCLSYLLFHLTINRPTGWIMHVPWLFRSASPPVYLIAPFSYLYVRSVIYHETRLRPWDWLHAIPAILHTFELAPFFFMDTDAKLVYMREILSDPELDAQLAEGMLPAYWHQFLKAGIGLIYLMAQWRIIIPQYRKKPGKASISKSILNWLSLETGLLTFLGVLVFFSALGNNLGINTQTYITLIVAVLFFFLIVFLFFRPEILYGIASTNRMQRPNSIRQKTDTPPIQGLQDHLQKIDAYLELQEPFLQKGFSLPEMARDLGIPRHQLSSIINQGYQMNFNELINRRRVEYACEKMDPALWIELSIEGIAQEVGFKTRFTFSKVFKQVTGKSPTQFRRKLLEV